MGKLECKEITKIYQDHRKAVDTVSFTVETKGIFGLIGRNGAGKTTLIRILSTELEPTSGTATINDFDILENTDIIREK
jgi:ABC-type multidrug transport system ATPase subunit